MDEKSHASSEVKLELERYKDLLSLREKEIQQIKAREVHWKKSEDNWKKKFAHIEAEKKELSNMLNKAKRSGSPLKPSSRTNFQIFDDAIKQEDLIGELDER